MSNNVTIQSCMDKIKSFCDARDWDQFHNVHSAALGGHRCGHQRPPCGAAATRN